MHGLVFFIILLNKEILIDHKTSSIRLQIVIQERNFRINNLITKNGAFLSHSELIRKYKHNCNLLQWSLQYPSDYLKRKNNIFF